MSLYQMIHGENPAGRALVALLAEQQDLDPGRFRDAWVEYEPPAGDALLIRVHTRNGGGNRECWCDTEDGSHFCQQAAIASMRAHPWFLRDADDDFDSTYADFWFTVDLTAVDPEIGHVLVEMAQAPVDVGARWRAVIDAIQDPGPSRAAPSGPTGPSGGVDER